MGNGSRSLVAGEPWSSWSHRPSLTVHLLFEAVMGSDRRTTLDKMQAGWEQAGVEGQGVNCEVRGKECVDLARVVGRGPARTVASQSRAGKATGP